MTYREDVPERSLRLGRHIEHDPRSWAYRLDDAVKNVVVKNVAWQNYSGILNQGNIGACVGFATCASCGTSPNWQALDSKESAAVKRNDFALSLYKKATELDEYRGTYPPNDTGSSGLGGAKAAMHYQLIKGYTHAFSFDAMTKGLMLGPMIVGTNWYSSMTNPVEGQVTIRSGSTVVGGHEYLVYGYHDGNFDCQNSWGRTWGVGGRFWMTSAMMERLLGERGDAMLFVPTDEPPPVPIPDPPPKPNPTPNADDLQLWTAIQAWKKSKNIT